jgi:hypothetical protein
MRHCDYVKPNGEFCGTPPLQGRDYCHWHLSCVGRRVKADKQEVTLQYMGASLDLPPLEDANSIQVAIMQVMDALLRHRIGPKISGQLLYALQIASSNLKLGVNFKPGALVRTDETQPQPKEAIICTAYETFEEDYNIGDQAADLKTAEAEAQTVEASTGAEGDDQAQDPANGESSAAAHPEAGQDESDTGDNGNASDAPAGRQKVLFGLRKPPQQLYSEWYSQRHANAGGAVGAGCQTQTEPGTN